MNSLNYLKWAIFGRTSTCLQMSKHFAYGYKQVASFSNDSEVTKFVSRLVDVNLKKPHCHLVLGKPKTGVTAFLKNVAETLSSETPNPTTCTSISTVAGSSIYKSKTAKDISPFYPIYIDLRKASEGTDTVQSIIQSSETFQNFLKECTQTQDLRSEKCSTIQELCRTIEGLGNHNEVFPVMLVDDAHHLELLDKEGGKETKEFLNWIVKDCAKTRLVLASSDSLFLDWLQDKFPDASLLHVKLIKEQEKKEVETFYLRLLESFEGEKDRYPSFEEDLYPLLGGCLHHYTSVATHIELEHQRHKHRIDKREMPEWFMAPVVRHLATQVTMWFHPKGIPSRQRAEQGEVLWLPEDIEQVYTMLSEKEPLLTELENIFGEQVIKSMVRHGLLVLWPLVEDEGSLIAAPNRDLKYQVGPPSQLHEFLIWREIITLQTERKFFNKRAVDSDDEEDRF